MKCKDCIHYEVCRADTELTSNCNLFADKALFIELPCKVGDIVYYRTPSILALRIFNGICHAITVQENSIQVHIYDWAGDNASFSAKDIYKTREDAIVGGKGK